MAVRMVAVVTVLTLIGFLAHGQQAGIRSGPQPGSKVPGSFEAHTFNGRFPERFRSLVCDNDAFPTALFILKEPAEGKDSPFKSLVAKLEELTVKYQMMDQHADVAAFASYVVFLSDAAQTSLTKPEEADPAALVKEASNRRALYARMRDWARDLKGVVVACTVPASVKAHEINPGAELTGIHYESFDVLENFAFAEGAFKESDVAPIIEKIEGRLKARIASLEASKKSKKGSGK